jgi:hypothetical protein
MIKTVVIVTMPRSGSSLLAGILQCLGVWMGKEEDLRVGNHLNKYGCYENQDFIALSENMLFNAKKMPDHSRRFDEDDEIMEHVVKKIGDKIKKVIKESERELWGFKNPTIIYTLPYFHQYLTNPYYIRLNRDLDSIARSFLKTARPRNWLPEIRHEFSYFTVYDRIKIIFRFLKAYMKKGNILRNYDFQKKIAEDGYKRIDRFLKGKRHLTIDLEDLLHNSQKMIQEIIAFLEISPKPGQIQDALGFIHQGLISF